MIGNNNTKQPFSEIKTEKRGYRLGVAVNSIKVIEPETGFVIIILYKAGTNSLYNFDALQPHFCIVKLGFTEVYIIFLISA